MSNELIIDIREENELLAISIKPKDDHNIEIISIPSRFIFANVSWIRKQSQTKRVWILCASSRRSDEIKQKYFPNDKMIVSSKGGINIFKDKTKLTNDGTHIDVDKIKLNVGKGGLSIQQYMQLLFILILSSILMISYYYKCNYRLNIFISVIIIFIVYQLISGSCLLSRVIPKSNAI